MSAEAPELTAILERQLERLKDANARRQLLSRDFFQASVACLKQLLEDPDRQHGSPPLLLLLRLLRNCAALEPELAGPGLCEAGLHNHLAAAVTRLSHAETGSNDALAALAQMLANWTGHAEAAARVWQACFPETWHLLVSYPSARVVAPSTLAIYRCCRLDASYSLQLCSRGGDIWRALIQSTQIKGSDSSSDAAGENEWLPLLVSCVAVRQGLLDVLMVSLGDPARAPNPRASCTARGFGALARSPREAMITSSTATQLTNSGNHSFSPVQHTPAPEVHDGASTPAVQPASAEQQAPAPEALIAEQLQQQGEHPSVLDPLGSESCTPQRRLRVCRVWSRHQPTLLHFLAHELAVMEDASPVGVGAGAALGQGQGAGAGGAEAGGAEAGGGGDGSGASAVMREQQQQQQQQQQQRQQQLGTSPLHPWQAALSCVVCILEDAARACCSPDAAAAAAAAAAAPAGSDPSLQEEDPVGHSRQQQELARHVLEAGFEVLKHLMLREDQGRQLFGSDPVEFLVQQQQLVHLLLAMLHSLEPVSIQRNRTRKPSPAVAAAAAAAAAAEASEARKAEGGGEAARGSSGSGSKNAALPVHAELAELLGAGFPVQAPYEGYRGDVVAVLSNAMFGRPWIADLVTRLDCVELMLAQCQLDELSPLAREWALWAMRNLCAGSEGARKRIQELEVVSAVETPDLERLGMRLEMDKLTGQMKMVNAKNQAAQESASPGN